ncbi:MAG TPA: pilus assembly protein N-terminal domain-containing protein [bacterium]
MRPRVGRFMAGSLLALAAVCPRAEAQPAAPPASPDAAILELAIGEQLKLPAQGVRRYLVGDPALLDVTKTGPNSLRLDGKGAGRTYLHVWEASGRTTHVVRVLPIARHLIIEKDDAMRAAIERAEALTLGYRTQYEMVRRGPTISDTDQDTTTRIRHTLTSDMPTPHGRISSLTEFYRVDAVQDLSAWWVRWADGSLGPLDRLDVMAGDTTDPLVGSSFAMPSLRYRGATVSYAGLAPWRMTGLWGQERFGIFGTPTTSLTEDRDANLYGFELATEDPARPWTLRAASLFGYGDDRGAKQSDRVLDLAGALRLTELWSMHSEFAASDDGAGYTLGSAWRSRTFSFGATYRDIEAAFETVLGPGVDQGERGLLLESAWQAAEFLRFRGRADIFRNRLFPNPAEPGALNLDLEGSTTWRPWADTTLTGFANRRRFLGQLFPNDDLRFGVSARQRLPARRLIPFIGTVSLTGRAEHQENRSVVSPGLDYQNEILSLGLSVPLPAGFTASTGYQWHFLEETLSGLEFRPTRFTSALNYFSSLGQGRWFLRGRAAYEDESSTGSVRSFLAGQDRLVYEAGLEFRPMEGMEWFVDGRVEDIRYERTGQDEVELTVFSGARFVFDANAIRWDPSVHIEGDVFHDANGDGIRQAGEEGLAGVTVVAGLATEAATDERGRFSFGRLRGLTIPVGIDLASLPKGFILSTEPLYRVRAETGSAFLHFGALGRAEVRGRCYYDADGDGGYGGSDVGLGGVQLTLGDRRERTDRTGWYFFRNLPGGSHTVSLVLESVPVHYVPKVPVRRELRVNEGETVTLDFPFAVPRVLEGRVYLDANGNARFDGRDTPVTDLPVCLDGRRVAKTDAAGLFRFGDFAAGRHALAVNCGMPMPGVALPPDGERSITVELDAPNKITADFPLRPRQ